MTFRTRLQLAFVGLAVASVGGLALGVRREMTRRLTAEYERRVASSVAAIRDDLARESEAIRGRLAALGADLADDNRFRLAIASGSDRSYVVDYAGKAMRLAGLSMLQVQDPTGRIISSGHFRNEFDRLEPALPALLARPPAGLALIEARTAEAPFLALVRVDSARVGGMWLTLVGGYAVDPDVLRRLARGTDLRLTLEADGRLLLAPTSLAPPPGEGANHAPASGKDTAGQAGRVAVPTDADSGLATASQTVAGEVPLPFVTASDDGPRLATARLVATQSLTPLVELRRGVDRWALVAGLVAAAAAILLGAWASARLSRPLQALAEKTATLDLTRLDVEFPSARDDEIGALARLLGAMTRRLRRDTQRLREAERRATVGDVARQVNHDVKNGLIPIRNVLRHLTEVAEQQPADLPRVFAERKATLDSGVQYLEALAANYARLSPRLDVGPSDVATVVKEVLQGMQQDGISLTADVPSVLPAVRCDVVVLRRILENLIGNAVDATAGREGGNVVVRAAPTGADGGIRITVSDNGPGMTGAELERAFEDFYSTKPGGTGLGLSVVRRLVLDLGGGLKVRTEPGAGTAVDITLPGMGTTGNAV